MLGIFIPRILDNLQVSLPIPEFAINVAGAVIGGSLVLWGILGEKRQDIEAQTKTIPYAEQWEHFNKFTDLILSLKGATNESRSQILADIERERNSITDRKLDEIISLGLDVVDWD